MEQNPFQKRVEVVDALRFCRMAIILVHNSGTFYFSCLSGRFTEWLEVLDQGVLNVVFSLLQ